jgi:hypothetical protein
MARGPWSCVQALTTIIIRAVCWTKINGMKYGVIVNTEQHTESAPSGNSATGHIIYYMVRDMSQARYSHALSSELLE